MMYNKLQFCWGMAYYIYVEVYLEAPKMYTNQLNNICNGGVHFFVCNLPRICFSTSGFQYFCSDLFCNYLKRNFRNFTNFYFPENLLVAAANYFKDLKIFISLKALQYIYRTADYDLRKPQMPRSSNGNLIVLKWQNIHVISNIKYTAIYIFNKTQPNSLLYVQQKRIQNSFLRVIKGVISLEVTTFTKKIHLRCKTIKTIKPLKANTNYMATLQQAR